MGRQEPHDLANDAAVELVVADAGHALAAAAALVVVNEHQVDVAAVIELFAAELPERQDDTAGGLASGGVGDAETVAHVPQGRRQGDFQGGVRHAGEVARDLLQRAIADHVVGADAQRLPLAKAAEHP